MMGFSEKHKIFIDEMQRSIREFETTAAARCDMSEDIDQDDLMTELERKFDELFGTSND